MATAATLSPMPDIEASETTPLVPSAAGGKTEPPPLPEMQAESLKEKSVMAAGGVSFLLSLLTLVFEAGLHPLVWLSGLLGIVIAPAAAFQQHKLTQVQALAQTNERLSAEVDELQAENGRLQASVQQMEESVLNLQAMEQTLSSLQSVQGQSVDELETQLQESKDILARMQTNQRGQVLQNIITVLLSADADGNMMLSDEDIDNIIRRLEGLHHVNIDDDKVRQLIIDNGRSIEAVMELARAAFATEENTENTIFSYTVETDDA